MKTLNTIQLKHVLNKEGKDLGIELNIEEIKDGLETFYEFIGCELIDIVTRKIGGNYYDIIIDDEGLLKDEPLPTMVSKDQQEVLYGNVIICGVADEKGELTSLTDTDVKNILLCFTKNGLEYDW